MKVREMIEFLKKLPQEDEVKAWDGDAGEYMPVTGAVYGGIDHVVELQTDDIT